MACFPTTMFNLSVGEIKQKLVDEGNLSAEQVDAKIKEKLSQLSGLVSEEGAAHIVANELGVKLVDTTNLQISHLTPQMRNVDLVGKAVQVYEVRAFNKENRSGKVGNFLLADQSGTMRVVLWNDQAEKLSHMKPGDVVRIKSGYVRDNQGRTELHLNDLSKLELNPEGVTVDVTVGVGQQGKPERKKLSELQETDQNVEVLGTIVQVYDPRFYEVCPECNKRIRAENGVFRCSQHGEVQPAYHYLINLYLDDGTANVRTVFFRDQALEVLGLSAKQMLALREHPGSFEETRTSLLGSIIKVAGRLSKNKTFDSTDFIARSVVPDPDPEEEIKQLGGDEEKPLKEASQEEQLYSIEELEEAAK